MPILLQTLCEAMTIKIKAQGHSNSSDLKDMSDLSKLITRKVIDPIKKHMKHSDFMLGLHDPVMVDGGSYHEKDGHLYIYTGQFKENWRARILGGVDHLLRELGVTTGTWKRVEVAPTVAEYHVLIPVLKLPTVDDPSPVILMNGGALEKIKELLSLKDTHDDKSHGSLSMKIHCKLLRQHIKNYYDEVEKGLSPKPPNGTIRYYIQELMELAEWANNHGIHYIIAH